MIAAQIWLDRFVARLLQLKPELSALEAQRIACVQSAAAPHLDPKLAAQFYTSKSAANE